MLVHHGVGLDWFRPLLEESALSGRYRVLSYHRVGYGGSSRVTGPLAFEQEAVHCYSLMRHLGIEQAHVVGHSASAMIALQLALDARRRCTPSRFWSQRGRRCRMSCRVNSSAASSGLLWSATGRETRPGPSISGCGSRRVGLPCRVDRALPDAFDQAVADADTFFGHELPAVQQWAFTQEDASRINQPALVVLGDRTDPIFRERRELLLAWLPNAEPFELPGATHLLHLENPRGMAEALAAFFARHPLQASL